MISSRQAFGICCSLLGLWLIVRGFTWAGCFVQSFSAVLRGYSLSVHAGGLIGPVASVFVGFLLIRYSNSFSRMLIDPETSIDFRVTRGWQTRFFTFCMRILGLVIFVRYLPKVAGEIATLFTEFYIVRSPSVYFKDPAVAMVNLLLGSYLLWGGRFVSRSISRM